ncbi:MAG: hypothetical protein RL687_338 [Candidatus Parcubacteria bacterium]|jgi:hypothetical protein
MKNKNLKNKGSSDLGLLLIVIFVLFLLWIFTGGANRPETQGDLFMKNPIEKLNVTP